MAAIAYSEAEPKPVLYDLLSTSLVLNSIIPNLNLADVFALSQTSHDHREVILQTPGVFRSVDLSRCRGAHISPNLTARIDPGGRSWRAERMDENLTEDEFYAGPLRGVFSKLSRMGILSSIQTLILDGLASVTCDLVSEMATNDQYAVKILSIRRCPNVNQSQLQRLLCYLCRPSRPEGTPRLQGVYIFTESSERSAVHVNSQSVAGGVTTSTGAQLGVIPYTDESVPSETIDPWYAPSGRVLHHGHMQRTPWEETLQTCKDIIAFNAVLCSHMHSHMEAAWADLSRETLGQEKPGILPLATVALGPEGCASCGRAPEGSPVWGESNIFEFPLLDPPPFSGRIADAVRPPVRLRSNATGDRVQPQRLIASCIWCLSNRYCENSCHKWWCADCYDPKRSQKLKDLERITGAGLSYVPSAKELNGSSDASSNTGDPIKVFNGFCVQDCLVSEYMTGAGGGGMWG